MTSAKQINKHLDKAIKLLERKYDEIPESKIGKRSEVFKIEMDLRAIQRRIGAYVQ